LDEKEKIEFFAKQISLEKEIVKTAENSIKNVKNNLVKELILAIALDSKKHAGMLNSLLTIASSVQPFIEEEKLEELSENIEKHIELEAKAIETYKEILPELENDQEKMIIQAIYHDELRHHALLKRILTSIKEREALTQEDIWDSIKDDFIPQY
jgi:rubrerythrin